MTHLASFQTISAITPIEGADKIELATVLGWNCVVRKGEFQPGDTAMYVEIDTIIPVFFLSGVPEDVSKQHHLRTVKMKGQLSQGLLIPLSACAKYLDLIGKPQDFTQYTNQDVSEIFGIIKYEKQIPIHLQGDIKGAFPSMFPITDEEKIQSNPDLIKRLWNRPFYITLKLDGTSGTFYKGYDGTFGVCSRKLELKDGDNAYWNTARKYDLINAIPRGCCIQGEICGPGIQKNNLGLDSVQFFIFNMYGVMEPAINENLYKKISFPTNLTLMEMWKIPHVPVIMEGSSFGMSMEELIAFSAEQKYSSGKKAEGIVVRSIDQQISFKVLNNKYLLEEKE